MSIKKDHSLLITINKYFTVSNNPKQITLALFLFLWQLSLLYNNIYLETKFDYKEFGGTINSIFDPFESFLSNNFIISSSENNKLNEQLNKKISSDYDLLLIVNSLFNQSFALELINDQEKLINSLIFLKKSIPRSPPA